jgi:hypothetical protein
VFCLIYWIIQWTSWYFLKWFSELTLPFGYKVVALTHSAMKPKSIPIILMVAVSFWNGFAALDFDNRNIAHSA